MPIPLSTLTSDCILLLNAGPPGVYGGGVTDPRWASAEVTDAVLHADSLVCAAIFRNKNNSRNQSFYVTQFGLAHGGAIGLNISGAVASVKFVVTGGSAPGNYAGSPWEMSEIQREIANALGLDYDAHYYLDDKVIWHNGAAIAAQLGATVSVDVTFPAFFRTGACLAPDEYAHVVLAGAMSLLVPVEGENAGPQSTWGQQFEAGIKMIAQGEGNPQQMAA